MLGTSPLPTELLGILMGEEQHFSLYEVESSLNTWLWWKVTGFLKLKFSTSLPILAVELSFC